MWWSVNCWNSRTNLATQILNPTIPKAHNPRQQINMNNMNGSGPDWLGLLKWSIAHTDGTSPTDAKQMSNEDKEWLERVMTEGMIKDEPARMNEIMTEMVRIVEGNVKLEGELEDKVLNDLEDLRDMIDQIDMAQVFCKFGGLKCLLGLLQLDSCPTDIRQMSASVIGSMCQNNITVQEDFFGKGVVDTLSRIYTAEEESAVRNKILFAISCLVRSHAAAEEYFVLNYLDSVLAKAIQYEAKNTSSIQWKLIVRGLFLSNALIISDYSSAQRITSIVQALLPGLVALLSHSLHSSDGVQTEAREIILHLLLSLSQTKDGHDVLSSMANGEAVPAIIDRSVTSQPGHTVFMDFNIGR